METWVMGVGLRPSGKLLELPPNPKAVARHSSIPTLFTFRLSVSDIQFQLMKELGSSPMPLRFLVLDKTKSF